MNVGTQIKQSFDGWRLMGTPFVFGLLLLLTPILLMVLLSFWTQDYLDLDRTFTLANYKEVFSHPVFITLIKRSVVISLFVTAFTVAHSITLILAAQGFVQLRGDVVEAIIALSIVWVAIENVLFKETSKWRYSIVFAFGLLHGLGFAALLTQYGLPKDNFISMLLAFNIGVEFGQLAVLLLAFILIKLIMKKNWYSNEIKIPASLIIAAIGLFWFIERII